VISQQRFKGAAASVNFNRIHSTFRFNGLITKSDQGGNRVVRHRGPGVIFCVRGEEKGIAAGG
jgi:hypothetical protein